MARAKKSKTQLDREINQALHRRGSAKIKSLETAVEDALDAFWASIASSYPQATSGDLSPGPDIALRRAATTAVEEWIESNVR